MLSCKEICKALSSFEGEQTYKLEHYNPLFEQSNDFSKKYLQLVEDKIKENGWVDPNIEPLKFKEEKAKNNEEKLKEEKEQENIVNEKEENRQKEDDDKCYFLNYKEHQTNDLPNKFLSLINESRRKELYYYGMKGPDSFLASVLLGGEPNYWLQHRKKKKEYADQIKTTLSIQKYDIMRGLSKSSIGNDFTKTIFSNDFPEHIDSDKSNEFQFLIGLHFNINILVIDLKEEKGHFTTDWNTEINTLILILDNQTYLPILSNKISYFNSDEIKNLETGFNILYPKKLELNETVKGKHKSPKNDKHNIITKASEIDIKVIKVEHIQNITKYQLKDLQDIAEKLNLQTDYQKPSSDGKLIKTIRKTKKELYDDIISKITSLGN